MIKKYKRKFKKAIGFSKKLPRIFGENTFFTFLGLLCVALIIGTLVFYQYYVLIERAKLDVSEEPIGFDEKTYQRILSNWQDRNQSMLEIDSKQYLDPFNVD